MDLFPFAYKGLIFHLETAASSPEDQEVGLTVETATASSSSSSASSEAPAHSAVVFLDSVRLAISLKCSGFCQRQPPCCK